MLIQAKKLSALEFLISSLNIRVMGSILFGSSNRIEIMDYKSFSRIYNLFWLTSVDFVIKLVKNREEAENITQDVFVQLWEKRKTLSNIEDIKNFLFICLRNKAFNYLREIKKSSQGNEMLWHNLCVQNIEPELAELEQKNFKKLEAAISDLSTRKQKIISLKFDENKSYREIGKLLSVSTNTVKNHLVQIKKRLRSEIFGAVILLISMC
jgi:RNA polymerase sigma-70 factor (ECF subfamily)